MQSMDEVDPRSLFEQRASVMKAVPRFMRGPFRNALKLALREVDQERGWKWFFMLPTMLLHKNPGGASISRSKLLARFEAFSRGE